MIEKTTVVIFPTQCWANLTMNGCIVLPTVSTKVVCFAVESAFVALLFACIPAAKQTQLFNGINTAVDVG